MEHTWIYWTVPELFKSGPSSRLWPCQRDSGYIGYHISALCMCTFAPNLLRVSHRLCISLFLSIPIFSKNKNILSHNYSTIVKIRTFNVDTVSLSVLGVCPWVSEDRGTPNCCAFCGRCWVMKWRGNNMMPMAPLALILGLVALGRATGKEAPPWTQRNSSGRSLGSSHHLLLEISRVYSVSLRR